MSEASQQIAARMKQIFASGGVAVKELDVFGSHCIATCRCFDSATKAARLLQSAGWQVKGPKQSIDYAKVPGCTNPYAKPIEVYRVWGKLQ